MPLLRRWTGLAGLFVLAACDPMPDRDVRFEPSPMPVVRAMLELAEVGPDDLVYDLGSGDGRIPIMAASEFGARGVGIEIDPELVFLSQMNAREAGVEDRVEFREGNMYEADVRPATVVTLFLHPGPNLRLRPTLRSDLAPGSRVVSYIWDMGDWEPDEVRTVGDRQIFLWRIAEPSAPGLSGSIGPAGPLEPASRRRIASRHLILSGDLATMATPGSCAGSVCLKADPHAHQPASAGAVARRPGLQEEAP